MKVTVATVTIIVTVVNFDTSINLVVNSAMFPHRNIHKYTWTFPNGVQGEVK
jgi:hypothetical protein